MLWKIPEAHYTGGYQAPGLLIGVGAAFRMMRLPHRKLRVASKQAVFG